MFISNNSRWDYLSEWVENFAEQVSERIEDTSDNLEDELEDKFDNLDDRLEDIFDNLEDKFDDTNIFTARNKKDFNRMKSLFEYASAKNTKNTIFRHYNSVQDLINSIPLKDLQKLITLGESEYSENNKHTVMLGDSTDATYNIIVTVANTTMNEVNKAIQNEEDKQAEPVKPAPIHKEKLKTKVKFIVGNKYKLVYKIKGCKKNFEKTFVCKQKIYYINEKETNVVIMKQIDGPVTKQYCLNKHDCSMYHIHYEPGLEVYSMNLNWKQVIDKK